MNEITLQEKTADSQSSSHKFHFIAGLFGTFWFPYKGMWKEWCKWFIPFAILTPILQTIMSVGGFAGFSIAFIFLIGRSANKAHSEFKKDNPDTKDSALKGVAGLALYLVILTFCENFTSGFANAFRAKLGLPTETSQQAGEDVIKIGFGDLQFNQEKIINKKIKMSAILMMLNGRPVVTNQVGSDVTPISLQNFTNQQKAQIHNGCNGACPIEFIGVPQNINGQIVIVLNEIL